MIVGEVVDAGEVAKLRDKVVFFRSSKLEHEKTSEDLTKENNASADRIFSLLTEKSKLISECDSLGTSVKELKIEKRRLYAALNAYKEDIAA